MNVEYHKMMHCQTAKTMWWLVAALSGVGATACSNAPYPVSEAKQSIRFTMMAEDPKTLDPNVAYDSDSQSIVANICDTFLEYQYLKRDPVVLQPSMGAAMPVRTPYDFMEAPRPGAKPVLVHGQKWTFRLKHGLHYADNACFPGGKGREVVAADFIYSLKRMADPTVNCPILSYLLPHVIGLEAFFESEMKRMAAAKKRGKPYVCDLSQPVQGLQVDPHDPYTFYVMLRDPYPELKYLMAMTLTAPVPHEAVEYYDGQRHGQFRRNPVGAGPYYLADWAERSHLILKRNPYYHTDRYPTSGMPGDRARGLLDDAGKPLPLVDEVVCSIIHETIPAWNLFQQGYLDSFGVPRESFDRVVTRQGTLSPEMVAHGLSMETAIGMDVYYIGFNMEDSLVGGYSPRKCKLRQALSMAFDRNEYLDIVQNGRGLPAQSPLPPGVFGYNPAYRNPYCQTNLTRARELLAQAGYPNGIDPSTGRPLNIYYDDSSTTPEGRQTTGLIIRQFESLGIHVTERSWTYTVFQDRVSNGQFQVMSFGWLADYPDPENFFLLFYGPNKGPGPNAARYENPTFDRLYEKMAVMDDGPARLAVIQQMQAILQRDCPWIYMFHSQDYILRYNWVKNAVVNPVAANTMKYIRIDAALRARKQREWNHPRYGVVLAIAGVLALLIVPAGFIRRRQSRMSARALRATLFNEHTARGGSPDRDRGGVQ